MTEYEIVDIIARFHPEVEAVYLFGSWNTPYERQDSDVDLALLLPQASAWKERALLLDECWMTLGELLARPVDLVNLRMANTVFQNEILRTGRVLFSHDEAARQSFEMLVLSFYQKLQQERAGIVEHILKSGKVYSV